MMTLSRSRALSLGLCGLGALALMIVTLRGCGKNDQASAGASAASSASTSRASSTLSSERPLAIPVLSLAVNNGTEATAVAGQPLMIEGSVSPPDLSSQRDLKPLTLGGVKESWSASVRLAVVDGHGNSQNWPWHPLDAPQGTITLDRQTFAGLRWYVAPEDTARLVPQTYTLLLTIDTTASPDPAVWKGSAHSTPVSITVAPRPPSLSASQQRDEEVLFARYEIFRGDATASLARTDAILARHPDDVEALVLKGDLLEQQGRHADSQLAYRAALAAYQPARPGALPLFVLRRLRAVQEQNQ